MNKNIRFTTEHTIDLIEFCNREHPTSSLSKTMLESIGYPQSHKVIDILD